MNEIEIESRIASLLRLSRYEAGVSQDFVAKRLGVSKKTIQNWEAGLSYPNVKTILLWFDIIDIPIYPYLFKIQHAELENINANSTDQDIREALISVISDLDISDIRKHFFEMFGNHGTAPSGMGEVKTAYLHLPMYVKVGIAEIICTQFEMAQARGELVKPDHVMPNIENLKSYIDKAKQAVIDGKDTYL